MDCAYSYQNITPSDTAANIFDGFHVGGGGTVVLTTPGGRDVTFTAISGGYLWVNAIKVKATGTTASGIVGLIIGD